MDPKEEEETLEKGADNDVEAALEDLGIAKMENAQYVIPSLYPYLVTFQPSISVPKYLYLT